eukprot:TRINITY_DN573_c0_g1_i2.p1 TRINITY_DN573_c0_g1~~TRINITY_DN573_c0_g1_i2.p1  ORF type:complete len:229 (-),score=46.17 TRINITY_DN573_c0_g1_i2:269-955(-)
MADSSQQLSLNIEQSGAVEGLQSTGSTTAPLSPILQPIKPEEPWDAGTVSIKSEAMPGESAATALLGPRPAPVWPWSKTGQRKAQAKQSKRGRSAKTPMKKAKTATKKKPKRESRIARKSDYKRKGWAFRLVKLGKKEKTSGGLTKSDLVFNARGKVVSKRRSQHAKKYYVQRNLDLWKDSVVLARAEMGAKGFKKINKGDVSDSSFYNRIFATWETKTAQRLSKAGA